MCVLLLLQHRRAYRPNIRWRQQRRRRRQWTNRMCVSLQFNSNANWCDRCTAVNVAVVVACSVYLSTHECHRCLHDWFSFARNIWHRNIVSFHLRVDFANINPFAMVASVDTDTDTHKIIYFALIVIARNSIQLSVGWEGSGVVGLFFLFAIVFVF